MTDEIVGTCEDVPAVIRLAEEIGRPYWWLYDVHIDGAFHSSLLDYLKEVEDG